MNRNMDVNMNITEKDIKHIIREKGPFPFASTRLLALFLVNII